MPSVNKVQKSDGTVLIDITGTTATAEKILVGFGAFGADGVWMDGTATPGSGVGAIYQDADGYVVLDDGNPYSQSMNITTNGTYNVAGYGTAVVNVPQGGTPSLQAKTKTYTPTESAQSERVTADGGYDGLSTVDVSVGAISASYVGSGVDRRDSTDLTASGATVTAPAGYYASAATKTINSGTATTPATTITATPSITVNASGLITASVSASRSVTPTVSAGYVSSGTAGTVSVSGSNTSQLTAKSATTYNTSTTDQTIASGQYLTGTQTIKAVTVSGLSAGNIASGVTVKVGDANDDDRIASVTGTLSFVTYYTGSGAPSSSLGSDGDIYLRTS